MDILHKIIKKCKSKEVLDILIIVLVGFGSFGLGKLSEISKTRPETTIYKENLSENQTASPASALNETPTDGAVVASKNGTKYHFPWCAGASQIADKNKIWFNSIKEAREAGYTPASNCKGLE